MIGGPHMRPEESMDLERLAYLGQFIGGIVVIGSLVYLARQVRQNTRAQRTHNYVKALDRLASIQARMGDSERFASVLVRGVMDPAALDETERVQFTWVFYEIFGAFEFMFHQAEASALPARVWERWAQALQWWMSFPGVGIWWDARPTPFSSDFTEFVEEHRHSGPPDPAAHERWVAFLGGGTAGGGGAEG